MKHKFAIIFYFVCSTALGQIVFNYDQISVRGLPAPAECPDGIILFKEDFGGNDPDDPVSLSSGIPQVTGYNYGGGEAFDPVHGASPRFSGNYAIRKYGYPNGSFWVLMDDHTYPEDKTRGYLLQVDGGITPGQFYSVRLDNLCAGSNLYFSAWAANVYQPGQQPNLTFLIEDLSGNELLRNNTGNIPFATHEDDWHQYGTSFIMPAGQTSAIFRIVYNGNAGNGNDFVLDDIEIRLCTPPVALQTTDTVCAGEQIEITSNFVNDGTFSEPLEYLWQKNTAGDLNNHSNWTPAGNDNPTLMILQASKSDEGYYRLAIAGVGGTVMENCRAMSDPVFLFVKENCQILPPPCSVAPFVIVTETTVCQNDSILFNEKYYSQEGIYNDSLKTIAGCDSITTLKLKIRNDCETPPLPCKPVVPDAYFSPNGDGIRDLWLIQHIECYDYYRVEIYDRYGKLLRRWENNFSGWDGMFNGKPMISTDYWYVIYLRTRGQNKYVGHFNLRR